MQEALNCLIKVQQKRLSSLIKTIAIHVDPIMRTRRRFPDELILLEILQLLYFYSTKVVQFCKLITPNKIKFAW